MAKLRDVLKPLLDTRAPLTIIKILEYVNKKKICYMSNIADDLRLPKPWVKKHLKRLAQYGLVSLRTIKMRKSVKIIVYATNRTEALLKLLNMEVSFPENVEIALKEEAELV